jgi:hypothetical protein
MSDLYISGGGNLYFYNGKLHPVLAKTGEAMMGLAWHGNKLLAGAKSRIYTVQNRKEIGCTQYVGRPDFHQCFIYENRLYITCTAINQVWELNLQLGLERRHKITPPIAKRGVKYKANYNHLNNIVLHEGKFYVCLNWLTSWQYGPSGVAVLDPDWEEVERFEYGWELHAFQFWKGKKYALCGSSDRIKKVNHPHQAGLMVDGKLVFEHETDVFCKDMLITEERIYIVGGGVEKRGDRRKGNGVLYTLSPTFRPRRDHPRHDRRTRRWWP